MLARGHTKLIQWMSLGQVDASLLRKSKIYYIFFFFLSEFSLYLQKLYMGSSCSVDAVMGVPQFASEAQRVAVLGRQWVPSAAGATAGGQSP